MYEQREFGGWGEKAEMVPRSQNFQKCFEEGFTGRGGDWLLYQKKEN